MLILFSLLFPCDFLCFLFLCAFLSFHHAVLPHLVLVLPWFFLSVCLSLLSVYLLWVLVFLSVDLSLSHVDDLSVFALVLASMISSFFLLFLLSFLLFLFFFLFPSFLLFLVPVLFLFSVPFLFLLCGNDFCGTDLLNFPCNVTGFLVFSGVVSLLTA